MKPAVTSMLPEPANDIAPDGQVRFLGLDFQPMRVEDAVQALSAEASASAPFKYVVTPNVDHMVRLDRDPSLRPLYDSAHLTLNDSRILEVLAKRDGHEFSASPGADIVELLFRSEINPNERINIIGCAVDDVDVVKEQFGLTNVHWYDAPMGLRHDPEGIAACAAYLAENPARFHFLCVGAPQQEMVAWAALKRGDVKGTALCCGASLDFLSGKTARAPNWMRKLRLEWLHRLATNPRRLAKRYLVDGPAILKIWRRHRQG